MEWFRWFHGSTTDPKFGLVARKAGVSVAEVVAVWATILEEASSNQRRGSIGDIDAESVDFSLGLPDGTFNRVRLAMVERRLLGSDGSVISWERRQPKREDSSAERTRQYRARKAELAPTPEPPKGSNGDARVTQRDAVVTHGDSRGDKRREERDKTPPTPPAGGSPVDKSETPPNGVPMPPPSPGDAPPIPTPMPTPGAADPFAQFWTEWPTHKRKVARRQCRAKWQAQKLDPIADKVLLGLRAAKRSADWAKQGGEFIPAPLVWLNQRRWEAPVVDDAPDWRQTRSGIEAKAVELGMAPWDEYASSIGQGESFLAYSQRVFAAAREAA